MEIPDEIIKGCINNKYNSQEWLYKKIFPYMMGICYRYTLSKEISKEITHEAIFKVLKNIEKYNKEYSFKTWISRITVNTIIDYIRKEKHFFNQDALPSDVHQTNLSEGNTVVYNDALNRLNVKYIYQLLEKLKPMEKNIFNLYAIDGYSHKEIAEMLDISEDLSKWYLKSARDKLKKWIMEQHYSPINI